MLDEESRAEMLEALGLGRGRPAHLPADRLRDARAADLPHHRGEGEPGLDLPGRVQGAAGRGCDPHRLRARVHPGAGHPLRRAPGRGLVGHGPRRRQACASRARTTRSPTATSSSSGSTSEPTGARPSAGSVAPMPWLVRDGEVLASVELADGRAARRRGLLGRDDVDGVLRLAGPVGAHHRHAVPARRRVLRRGRAPSCGSRPCRRWRISRPRRCASRSVFEARAGTFREWTLRPGDVLEVR